MVEILLILIALSAFSAWIWIQALAKEQPDSRHTEWLYHGNQSSTYATRFQTRALDALALTMISAIAVYITVTAL